MARITNPINSKVFLNFLVWGLVFLWLINQFVDFAAINQDCTVEEAEAGECVRDDVFKSLTTDQIDNIAGDGFKWILVAAAVLLAFKFGFPQGRLDKKALITMVIVGVLLFFLYDRAIVPLLDSLGVDLPSLGQSAIGLQSLVGP